MNAVGWLWYAASREFKVQGSKFKVGPVTLNLEP